jgi:hypothetical protein
LKTVRFEREREQKFPNIADKPWKT